MCLKLEENCWLTVYYEYILFISFYFHDRYFKKGNATICNKAHFCYLAIVAYNCPVSADLRLTDISNGHLEMETNGWVFDILYHNDKDFKSSCGISDTWFGYSKSG